MVTGLTPPEPFRWFPADGARHAVLRGLVEPGATGDTLCGAEVVVPKIPPPKYPDGLWPTCPKCDEAWREDQALRAEVPAQGPLPDRSRCGAGGRSRSRTQPQKAGVSS
ncbi:zinc finger protein [Lentzea albidocapillata]|uniref:zinc finger protein n=1 Tax=Lentzea albidocapillata TaxID=40571 RepID=UPI00115FECE6|nr:zinc finger protein [Lentzea albidocapillata]